MYHQVDLDCWEKKKKTHNGLHNGHQFTDLTDFTAQCSVCAIESFLHLIMYSIIQFNLIPLWL